MCVHLLFVYKLIKTSFKFLDMMKGLYRVLVYQNKIKFTIVLI